MKRTILRLSLFILLMGGMASARAETAQDTATPKTYSLKDCLQIAADHNPEIRLAGTQFLSAQGKVIQLHAILYPTANVQALTTPLDIYVQLNQVIYSEATFPQLRLGRLTQEQAVINYRQTLNDVVFQVRQAFINVIATRDRVEIIQKFMEGKLKAIQSAQALYDAGQLQKSVVTNVTVQAGLLKKLLADDQVAYVQAKLFLENLLGQALPENARFTGDFTATIPNNLDAGQLMAVALRDREDLKLLESQQLSEEQQIRIDMKSAYPIIGASSNSTIQPPALAFANDLNPNANYNEPQTVVAAGQTQLPLSLYFTWVIFDGGLTRGVKMSDEANLASRDVAISALKQSITGEIGDAVSRIITQRESLKTMGEQPKPEDLRKLADASFQAGDLRQLDMVNLENDILQQELLNLTSQYQLCQAAATLDHALGHGLKIIQAAAPQPHP